MLKDERITCETQQSIYESMAVQGYDMKVFSDAFLSSDFCRRAWDTIILGFSGTRWAKIWIFTCPR